MAVRFPRWRSALPGVADARPMAYLLPWLPTHLWLAPWLPQLARGFSIHLPAGRRARARLEAVGVRHARRPLLLGMLHPLRPSRACSTAAAPRALPYHQTPHPVSKEALWCLGRGKQCLLRKLMLGLRRHQSRTVLHPSPQLPACANVSGRTPTPHPRALRVFQAIRAVTRPICVLCRRYPSRLSSIVLLAACGCLPAIRLPLRRSAYARVARPPPEPQGCFTGVKGPARTMPALNARRGLFAVTVGAVAPRVHRKFVCRRGV